MAARVPLGLTRAEGFIKNVNTMEEFKNTDKRAMMKRAGQQVGFPSLAPCSGPRADRLVR